MEGRGGKSEFCAVLFPSLKPPPLPMEAETTQRELLRQVGQLSEKLEMLRRQRADCDKQDGLPLARRRPGTARFNTVAIPAILKGSLASSVLVSGHAWQFSLASGQGLAS